MTFKELLDSVTFDDVEKQIVRLYPDMKNSLGWYKLHFDIQSNQCRTGCLLSLAHLLLWFY